MNAVVAPPRKVHVEHCMGTVFTIDIRDGGEWAAAITEVIDWLHHVDRVFSTYDDTSDISRIQREELRVADADPAVAAVLKLCAAVQLRTAGAFTAMWHGKLDPTGLVKGWAIELASAILRRHGSVNHAVNGGGDMQVAGEAAPGRPWSIGISDPINRRRVLTTVTGREIAVATSGTAERGRHILDPFTGQAVSAIASATVIGPSLTFADAYATAAVVLGSAAIDWIDGIAGYEAMLVCADATVLCSRGWPGLRLPRTMAQ